MEKLGGSGDGTSNHLSQTSNNVTVPLDTILKDKEFISFDGPTTSESDWKRLSPCLQAINGQILAHHQHNNKSCVRESMVSIHSRGCTAVLPRENCPPHESQQCSSNDRSSERSATVEMILLQKCPIQRSSSSFESQNASSASATTNISQQFMPHMIVQNTKKFSGSWKNNLYNQQQHVKITNNSLKDSIGQGLFTDVGHFGVLLAEGQTIKLCQQNVYMPKDIYQQKYVPQKAIAVVTPLTQQVVAGVTFSKNVTKVNEGGFETKPVPNKTEHQTCIPHLLQSATNESGTKTSQTSQTEEVPSKSVLDTGSSDFVEGDGPAEDNKLPGQSEQQSSVLLNNVTLERKEEVQTNPTDDNCSAKLLSEDDAAAMVRNSEETRMDARMDKLSAIPVNEWSLQRLCTLVTELEQLQKRQQKDIPFIDPSSEILKMYWNGGSQKLCNAVKSNIYINIMKEVRLHSGTENSIILQGVSRETLSEIASNFHILEHDVAPPKMTYTSCWLNLSEKLDIDSEHDMEHCLSSLMTLHCKTKNTEKEATMKEKEHMQEPKSETIKASNSGLSEKEKRSKPLLPEHQKILSVKGHKMVRKERVISDAENTSSVKETEGKNSMTTTNVIKTAQSEKQNKMEDKNEARLIVSLSTQSSASDSSIKVGNLLSIPTTDAPPVLDKNGSAGCASVEMTILPPEEAASEPHEKEDAQILAENKGQVTVKLVDQDKQHMPTDIKSNERSSRIKIFWQLENYCCIAKWFQVMGYRNGGLCKCEIRSEPSNHDDITGKGVKEVNANKYRHPFNKPCKHVPCNRQAKNRLGYRCMTGKNSITSPIDDDDDDDASIDELEIVEVITNRQDVLKMANAMSEQSVETPHITCTSHESRTGRKHCRVEHKEMTVPEFKTCDTLINLALFGTSQLKQKKKSSLIRSSDKVQLPPERIHVKIDSGWNECTNSTKQQVWNSWKKTYVPSNMSTTKWSKKRKHAKAPEPKNAAADNPVTKTAAFDLNSTLLEDAQTQWSAAKNGDTFAVASADKQKNTATDQSKKKTRKKICSSRKDKIRKLKQNKMLASFSLSKKRICTSNGSKPMKSSLDPAQAVNTSKNKLSMGVALNFRVLPESFSISDGSSSREASQSANADSGSKVNTVVRIKRTCGMSGTTWCISPRKKQCLQPTPTLPNTSGPSTFQKFKKKYEEKKQSIPI